MRCGQWGRTTGPIPLRRCRYRTPGGLTKRRGRTLAELQRESVERDLRVFIERRHELTRHGVRFDMACEFDDDPSRGRLHDDVHPQQRVEGVIERLWRYKLLRLVFPKAPGFRLPRSRSSILRDSLRQGATMTFPKRTVRGCKHPDPSRRTGSPYTPPAVGVWCPSGSPSRSRSVLPSAAGPAAKHQPRRAIRLAFVVGCAAIAGIERDAFAFAHRWNLRGRFGHSPGSSQESALILAVPGSQLVGFDRNGLTESSRFRPRERIRTLPSAWL